MPVGLEDSYAELVSALRVQPILLWPDKDGQPQRKLASWLDSDLAPVSYLPPFIVLKYPQLAK